MNRFGRMPFLVLILITDVPRDGVVQIIRLYNGPHVNVG